MTLIIATVTRNTVLESEIRNRINHDIYEVQKVNL